MKVLSMIGMLFATTAMAIGADHYVAKSGTYVDDGGVEHEAYTSIVAAVNADAVKSGDTVWVEDGYVADNASDPVMNSDRYKCQVRLFVKKSITLRSKSGTYDEAKGLGVTIKGGRHSATTPCGTSAIRCLRTETAAGGVYRGIIFDGGCGPANQSYTGGGAYTQVATTFTNCLFRNCYSYIGGGLGGENGTICYDCVFTNNAATYGAGGAVINASCVNCLLADNEAPGGAGFAVAANKTAFARNCQILRNRAKSSNGGGVNVDAAGVCTLEGCRIADNEAKSAGGGVYGPAVMTNAWIVGNTSGYCGSASNAGGGGGVNGGGGRATLIDCHVLSNRTISANNNNAAGGGASHVNAVLTEFVGNSVEGCYGGVSDGVLTDCQVSDNVATNGLSTKNASWCGGIGNSTATNCVIAGNVCRMSTGYGSCGGVYNSQLVGCVVSNNTASGFGGGVYWSDSAAAGMNFATNSVIVGNDSQGGGGIYAAAAVGLHTCRILRNRSLSSNGGGVCLGETGTCTIDGCRIVGNEAKGAGGGVYGPAAMTNTWVVGNVAGFCVTGSNNGGGGGVNGGSGRATLTDCHVLSNRSISAINNYAAGGGAAHVTAVATEFVGNVVEGTGAAVSDGVLTGCTILSNLATNGLSTVNSSRCGGISSSVATNCLIAGNVCRMSTGRGSCGGAYNSRLVGCVVSNNTTVGTGGGLLWSGTAAADLRFAANCTIVDNVSPTLGGGVYAEVAVELYNCLIARNRASSNVGAAGVCSSDSSVNPLLVNCTVTENDGDLTRSSGIGGVCYVSLLNTVVWNNIGKGADVIRGFARYSCGPNLTDAMGEGNSTADPKLTADYRLKSRSPCRRTGFYDASTMGWAADADDPRHLDLQGCARLNGDGTIDRGCYGWTPRSGFFLILR